MSSMRMNPGSQSNYTGTPNVAPQSQPMSGGSYRQGPPPQPNDQGGGNMMNQNSYSELWHVCIAYKICTVSCGMLYQMCTVGCGTYMHAVCARFVQTALCVRIVQ